MSFLDRLRPASYRGVVFHVDTEELQGGKRVAVHLFPGRDDPYLEELGMGGRQVRIAAYLTGDDYASQREALIEALDTPGAAELVLPDRAPFPAIALHPWTSRQGWGPGAEGGIARLDITFIHAPQVSIAATDDTRQAVRVQGDTLLGRAVSAFTSVFNAQGGDRIFGAAVTRTSTVALGLRDAASKVLAPAEAVAALVRDANALADDPSSAITSTGVGGQLGSLFSRIATLGGRAQETYATLASLGGLLSDLPAVSGSTVQAEQERANQSAFQALVRQASLGASARASVDLPLESAQDAAALRGEIADRIDAELLLAQDDEAFSELQALLLAVVTDLDARAARLPTRRVYGVPALTCSLAVAYRLYGTLDGELDLVARNRPAHPGFIPQGTAIEYLVA
jgi:prophage DNA circulation protein